MNIIQTLQRRGLLAQATHLDKIEQLLESKSVTFYIGFDPTADSLHVGSFLQLVVMAHLQKAGHRPIALLGTGTSIVGDPSGKSDMRKMLTHEEIAHNAACIQKQMEAFLDFSDDKALLLQNGDWLSSLNYLAFVREIGVHFSVNKMLAAECYKSRLERGLSFFELNYMLLQSYDFLHMSRTVDCQMQLGGDDQWSNILGGVELIRRVEGKEAYGLTFTLLTTKDGKKMGKTEKGAIWLDKDKTSPYEFFQYWRNVDDEEVIPCLKMLTFLPIEEIEAWEQLSGNQLNPIKEKLAFTLTEMIHGTDDAQTALDTAKSLFTSKCDSHTMPSTALSATDFADGNISLLELLVKASLAPSKAEARRLVQQGGVCIREQKCSDVTYTLRQDDFADGGVVIKKGKKIFHKITLES